MQTVFSVATNFDPELPAALADYPVRELFGACDAAALGHGRPLATTPPVNWRQLETHATQCRDHGMGFNLLLNAMCLGAQERSVRLTRRLDDTLRRAVDCGVTGVTVGHPWVLERARMHPLQTRVSVFVGISTVEQARFWSGLGAAVLALDTHVLCRDLHGIRGIVRGVDAQVELPVNIGCVLRCPLARTHAARIAHASQPGAQPLDDCAAWCANERAVDPVNLLRADFIRPEDLSRYEELGVSLFKIVDRSCSTEALVERVDAWTHRRWSGDLLRLMGRRGAPPRSRRLPVFDAVRHLGIRGALQAMRDAPALLSTQSPWVVDNAALGDLLLPRGCKGTGCEACGHCAGLVAHAVRPAGVSPGGAAG